jgi:hypothetical protein
VTLEEYGAGHARFYRRYHVFFWATQTLSTGATVLAIAGCAALSGTALGLAFVAFFAWRHCNRRWLAFVDGYLDQLRAEHRRLAEESHALVASLGGKELH